MGKRLGMMVAVLCLLTQIGRADDSSDQVKTIYDRGMAHFRLEEYDLAIEKWLEGFRLKPAPEFLYNIAQAYRLSKRHEKAKSFYQKYLLMVPNPPNKQDVLRHIQTLDRAIDADQRASTAPPTQPLSRRRSSNEPPDRQQPEPTPRPTPEPAVSTPEPAPVVTAPTPAPVASPAPAPVVASVSTPSADKPIHKKGWFWGVIGASAAVVVAVVVVGAVVGTSGSGAPTLPALRF